MLRPLLLAALAPPLALLLAACTPTEPPEGAGLDTRAASQRRCLEVAEAQGLTVLHLGQPGALMGPRVTDIWGERVRMRVAAPGGEAEIVCTYVIGEMEAYLRRR